MRVMMAIGCLLGGALAAAGCEGGRATPTSPSSTDAGSGLEATASGPPGSARHGVLLLTTYMGELIDHATRRGDTEKAERARRVRMRLMKDYPARS